MSAVPSHGFAAQLLERGASGYAGYAAAALLDREPAIRERFGPEALSHWKHHLSQRILELSAALVAAEPKLFVARVLWTAKAFQARHQDTATVRASIEVLREVLAERLPEAARAVPLDYLDQALHALSQPPAAGDDTFLDPARPADALALRYLQKVLEGDVAGAVGEVVNATRQGFDVRSAYLEVLLPAQREIGRLWHLGQVSVAEEHLVTSATQRTMAVLASSAKSAPANGKCAVVAAVASNAHDVGLRAVADLYQMSGWRTIFLGADVPMEDLPAVLNYFQADLLLLGATLATQVPRVQQTIAAVRSRGDRPVKVIVGGAAFDEVPELWRKLGADGYAARVDDAVALGGRLVGV
jgi:methanogenic corrinoid protein MtbC1